MNAICCGGICVGMSGAKQHVASKFLSWMSAASKLTMVRLTYPLSNVSFKPIRRVILSLPSLFYSICSRNVHRAVLPWSGTEPVITDRKRLEPTLESVNQGLDEDNWKITCIRFAPNAPQQNPIEDIWLQAKRFIRECYHLCKSFGVVKYLFEFVTHRQVFDFPKLFTYGCFSQVI